MKIKNEIVILKIGDKKYEFNNLILDEYLNTFVRTQLSTENLTRIDNSKNLAACLLKFDTPIYGVTGESVVGIKEFDVSTIICQSKQINSKNRIVAEYTYNMNYIMKLEDVTQPKIQDYKGKKITAIGFTTTWMTILKNFPIKAFLDVSNYNIYVQENQDISITRRDIIETEADFFSPFQNISIPVHLSPQINEGTFSNTFANLAKVGFGYHKNEVSKEYNLDEVQLIKENTKFEIYDIKNYNCPFWFYPGGKFPFSFLYPLKENYKYLFLRYDILKRVEKDGVITVEKNGEYYYQILDLKQFGNTSLTIKYERS